MDSFSPRAHFGIMLYMYVALSAIKQGESTGKIIAKAQYEGSASQYLNSIFGKNEILVSKWSGQH